MIWTPCNEELPPENHTVLVSIYNEDSEPWYVVTKRSGDFWDSLGHEKNIIGDMAWMELPVPYKPMTEAEITRMCEMCSRRSYCDKPCEPVWNVAKRDIIPK